MSKYRSHNCSELRKKDIGIETTLSGWINKKRDHGNLLFIDLRDNYGITQCIIEKGNSKFSNLCKNVDQNVFSIGTDSETNEKGSTIIAYCWSEISGYSKFGSYKGGTLPFIYLGFKPAYFLLKEASATNGCSMAVNIKHNIERNNEFNNDGNLCSTQPISFIERFCSKLNYNNELVMVCKFVAKKVHEKNMITDNIPQAVAAGIVYFTGINCNQNVIKQDIKNITGVSEVTINKCFKKLELNKNKLLPEKILKKYN